MTSKTQELANNFGISLDDVAEWCGLHLRLIPLVVVVLDGLALHGRRPGSEFAFDGRKNGLSRWRDGCCRQEGCSDQGLLEAAHP